MKFSFALKTFLSKLLFSGTGSGFHYKNLIPKSYALYMKDTHKIWCRSVNFYQNQSSDQDQNQDQDISLPFRTTFYTWQTPTEFC